MVQTAAGELLDLPRATFQRDRLPTLVVFDEFQDLLAAGHGLDGLVRSHVQYHAEAAQYVYAGSHPSLMRRLFADRERPLYGQAEPLQLGLLPVDETLSELGLRFAELDRDPVGALHPLVQVAAGHPQRTMLLAHLLHRELVARDSDGSLATTLPHSDGIALADAVVAAALSQTNEAHQAVWDGLATGKRAVLAALAAGVSPTGSRVAGAYGLARATLQSVLRDLDRAGQHLVREANTWRFVDPLLRLWVDRRGEPVATSSSAGA